MKKKLGYYLFAMFFCVFRIVPVNPKKVFMIATHDDSEEGNIGIVSQTLKETRPEIKQVFLTKRDGIRRPFSFFFGKAYHLATAGAIFMDNIFMPMAYTPFSKKTKVVQLWHGTGTIKKFGQDSDVGEVARISKKANERITHLIVNSEYTKKQYAKAFGVPENKAFILGLPRTDGILDEQKRNMRLEKFYLEYPELKEKRCVLYAPTFRDEEAENPTLALDIKTLCAKMSENEVLLLRLHPFVAEYCKNIITQECEGKIYNMSTYSGVTTLLEVADCLITDYSSIVYEYCLLERPMIFYAYDLEKFQEEGRSFYEDYESFVPGPVVKSQSEWMEMWSCEFPYKERINEFKKKNYAYMDKKATERLLELIFQ